MALAAAPGGAGRPQHALLRPAHHSGAGGGEPGELRTAAGALVLLLGELLRSLC